MVYRWEKNRKKTCQEIGRVTKMAWHGLSRSKWLASLTPGDWANQAPSKWDGETDVETRHPSIRDLISSFFQERKKTRSVFLHYLIIMHTWFHHVFSAAFLHVSCFDNTHSPTHKSRFSARSLLLFFFSSWRCRVYTSRNASQVEKRRQRTHHHHPRNGRHVSSHDNSTQKLWK